MLTGFGWGSCKRTVPIPFKSRGFESAAVIDYRAGSGVLFLKAFSWEWAVRIQDSGKGKSGSRGSWELFGLGALRAVKCRSLVEEVSTWRGLLFH